MHSVRRRRALLLGFALVLVTVAAPAVATASKVIGGAAWNNGASPLQLTIGNNVSGEWDALLRRGVADWNRSPVIDLDLGPGKSNPATCRPVRGRIEVCSGRYGNTGWLGVTELWIQGDRITQATIRFNETYFDRGSYNDPTAKRHVVCHELGHALGLDHAGGATCMNDKNRLYAAGAADPSQGDFKRLARLYPED